MDKTAALPSCKNCSYLSRALQKQYNTIFVILPFCLFYELHFSSVRQINENENYCPHYDEGHL